MGSFNYMVQALCEHDGGSGRRIYAGGSFSVSAPSGTTDCVVSHNGSGWSLLPAGYMLSWCNSLTSFQLPGGARTLLVSGSPVGSDNYCRGLTASGWVDVGGEFITVVDDALVYDDGSGAELFTTNGTFNGVNKYNGVRRAALGGNVYQSPQALVAFGEGSARRLIVGGALSTCAGVAVKGAASWNGASWAPLGGPGQGVFRATVTQPGTVHAAAVWDDGSGEKVWMGGQFVLTGAANIAAQNLAWCDGVSWGVPSAGGVTGLAPFGFYNGIEAMAVFDFDGPGGRPASLVVAGQFTGAGGLAVSNLAVLDAAWCGAADVGRQGGLAKHDGRLDNNDFVAFIELFFAGDVRADVGVQGGVAGRDGVFDNNDFVVFVDAFFGGC